MSRRAVIKRSSLNVSCSLDGDETPLTIINKKVNEEYLRKLCQNYLKQE